MNTCAYLFLILLPAFLLHKLVTIAFKIQEVRRESAMDAWRIENGKDGTFCFNGKVYKNLTPAQCNQMAEVAMYKENVDIWGRYIPTALVDDLLSSIHKHGQFEADHMRSFFMGVVRGVTYSKPEKQKLAKKASPRPIKRKAQ